MTKIPRAYSYADIEKITFKTIKIDDDWKEHLGEPQLGNSHWLVYGGSGEGKTTYVLQVVKQICSRGQKVHYNTKEEGMKKGFQMALKRNNMKGVLGFNYHQETLEQLSARLGRQRQAKIVVIDSVQYFFRKMRSEHYFDFISQFEDTTFIWISGSDGNKPRGQIANDIYYDADIVINVSNYQAVIEKNRFEAYEPRIIWQQGYNAKQVKLLEKG
jgi:predicted ATP-dependent serine protease